VENPMQNPLQKSMLIAVQVAVLRDHLR
jgi:hypothetical protein